MIRNPSMMGSATMLIRYLTSRPLRATGFAALVSLMGCSTPVDQLNEDPTFGEAVRRNMAMQIINPPPAEVEPLPPADGNRRSLMIYRYQTDTVEPPREEFTSDKD
jgi:hypothetical protein